MRSSEYPQIRALGLFSSMHDGEFERLMSAAYLQKFPAGVQLIAEGEPADFLYIVVSGRVEMFASGNGRETTMFLVEPEGTFILAAVLKDAVYLMSARTAVASRMLMVPAEDVRAAIAADDGFARAMVSELACCYRGVVKDHKDLKLRTSVERLANRLVRYHVAQGEPQVVHLPTGKKSLAALLGMTPENLSRAFGSLKPYGVEVDGPNVRLNDIGALKGLAKPNPLIDDQST